MNYEMIQDNIDASTLAAIYAKTEESLLHGSVN